MQRTNRSNDPNMQLLCAIVLLIFFVGPIVGTDLDAALKFFLSSGNSRSSSTSNRDPVKNLYDLFKKEFKKNTKSLDDDKPRLASFNETLNVIADQYRQGDRNFSLELNEYADWTRDELDKLRGTLAPEDDRLPIETKSDDRPGGWEGKTFMSKSESNAPATNYDFVSRVVSGTSVPVVSQTSIDFPSLHSHYRSNLSRVKAPVDPVTLSPSSLCSSFSSLCN